MKDESVEDKDICEEEEGGDNMSDGEDRVRNKSFEVLGLQDKQPFRRCTM